MLRPTLGVQVLMRHERVKGPMSRWQSTRWCLHDVILHEGLKDKAQVDEYRAQSSFEIQSNEADHSIWSFAGFEVALYKDDVQGYHLNLSSGAPCWFVFWRAMDWDQDEALRRSSLAGALDSEGGPIALQLPFQAFALPQIVTLSYHDAGRWLDAQEQVEQVPLDVSVQAWLQEFCQAHWVDEPKVRKRPQSFQAPSERGALR